MFSSYKIEGIILKRINLGESDKILTVFAKNYGKIKCLAKGIRKINSRRAPHLELFNYSRLTIHRGRNFDIITEAESINSFGHLRKDVSRVAAAYYLAEIVDKLCPEHQEHNQILTELVKSLVFLNETDCPDKRNFLSKFNHFILTNLGYMPEDHEINESDLHDFIEKTIEKKLKTNELLIRLREC